MDGLYFLRYQRGAGDPTLEERFDSERQALVQAFARITHGFVHRVWIEDGGGRIVIDEAELRERCNKEVLS